MIVYDKNIFGSSREIDSNGFLRVEMSNITKSQVRAYLGREIPDWRDFNLDPEKIYNVLCPEEELIKAVPTFNNLPLTRDHIAVDVDNVPKERIVGSLGDHATYEKPYIKNNLIVYDKKDIDLIMSGKKKELSCGYRYTPVREDGEFEGQHYDFKMTDIVGNHIALVKQGRAGRDVMVADSIKNIKDKIMSLFVKNKTVEDSNENLENLTDDEDIDTISVDIPEQSGKPQEAGEEDALQQGEKEMAEEVKEEVKVEEPAPVVEDSKPAPADKPVEDACTKDACSEKVEEKTEEKAEEVVEDKCGESKAEASEEKKEEEKPAEDEGKEVKAEEKPAEAKEDKKEEKKEEDKKDEKKEEMAKDSALVMDADAIRAEARQEAIEDFKGRDCARKAVRSIVGDVDIFAFDSAEDIYKFACGQAGMDLEGIANFKDAFIGLKAGKAKLAMDASPISGSNEECLKNIRLA